MPSKKNIREKLALIETQSLSLVANEMLDQSGKGRMITHVPLIAQLKNELEASQPKEYTSVKISPSHFHWLVLLEKINWRCRASN